MRHNSRRSKGGKQGFQGNNNKKPSRTRVYESNGPDVRIRGTAWQVTEKYQALAKDAESSGNWVLAESYHQHAEHYQRIINSFEDATPMHADKQIDDVEEDIDTAVESAAPTTKAKQEKQLETVAA